MSRRTQVCRTPQDEAGMGHVAETGRVSQVRRAWSAQVAVLLVPITVSRGRSRREPRGTPGHTRWGVTLDRSDLGIHAAPRVMAQVVRRAAEGSIYGMRAA